MFGCERVKLNRVSQHQVQDALEALTLLAFSQSSSWKYQAIA